MKLYNKTTNICFQFVYFATFLSHTLYMSDKLTLTVGENYWMSELYSHFKGTAKQNNFRLQCLYHDSNYTKAWIGFDGMSHTSS